MTVQSAIELAASYFDPVNLGTMNYGMTRPNIVFPLEQIIQKNPYFAQMYEQYGDDVFNPEVTKNCGGPYYALQMTYPTKFGSYDPNVSYKVVHNTEGEIPCVVFEQTNPNPIAQAAVAANCLLSVGIFTPDNPDTPAKVISWLRFIKAALYNLTFDCEASQKTGTDYPWIAYVDVYPILELYYPDNIGGFTKTQVSNIDAISITMNGAIVPVASRSNFNGLALSGLTKGTDYTFYPTTYDSSNVYVANQTTAMRETIGFFDTSSCAPIIADLGVLNTSALEERYKNTVPVKLQTYLPGGKNVTINGETYKTHSTVPVYIRFHGKPQPDVSSSGVDGIPDSCALWHFD